MASSESEKNLPPLSTNDSDKGLSSSSSDKDASTPVNEAVTADVEKKMLEQAPVPAQMANNPVEPPSKPAKNASSGKAKKSQKPDPYENLPEDEAAILKRQLDIPPAKVNYFTLYRYATRMDLLIIFVSCICAMAAGAAMPLMTVVFGSITGDIGSLGRGDFSHSHFSNQVDHNILYFIYLAIGEFCTVYISMNGFMYTGQHISNKIREQYLASILRQNIGYFDRLGAGEITTRITSDTNNVQDAISEKVGLTLSALATFVTAYIIAFIKYWKLALILSSSVVAILITMTLMSKFIVKYNKQALFAYAKGGTIVEEVLSSIRNATAFGTQDKLAKEYDVHLAIAQISGVRQKALLGSMIGILMFYSYLSYSLCFWQGSRYLRQGVIGVQDIITILLSIMMGAFQLGNVAPNAQAATTGVAAAAKIYATIDRKSPLDPQSEEGEIYDHIDGNVELRNIKHIYPSRPEVVVMNDVNLVVPAGKTTALVGASGSGKSTIVGLVERFYDPVGGEVLLDGHNVQNINLRWLRQQVSLVSQEPTLFATTIFTNIRHGLIGTEYEYLDDEKVTELIENAAKLANAHDFITQLPEGYQTNVGDRGFLMSGGQKQRIAIARAMVSNPKILFLDEATSALDTKSEGVVQAALDKAAQGRTTIVIAHRLSTIKHADNIVVMSQGRIIEQGRHDALLESQGAYYNLVEAQRIAQLKEDASREEGEEGEEVAIFDEKDGNILGKEATEDEEKAGMGDYIEDPADLELGRMKTGKSASSKVIDNKVEAKEKHYSLWTLIKVVAGYNRQEWMQMTLALFFAIISGASNPTASVFFAKSLTILSVGPLDQISFWSWMYFMLAFVTLIARVGMGVLFAYCSEQLVHRARDEAFRTMLRQDISFFDQDKNSAGALTSFLSTQTTQLAGMSGITLGTILQTVATLVIGYVIALAIGWKLALVCIATVPIVLGCGFFRFWMLARFQANSRAAYEKSAAYACEATSAIRTVASLTREQDVFDNYDAQLVVQFQRALGNNLRSTALYAASQSLMFLCIALAFWYGSTLLNSGEYSEFQFFLCFSAVIFGSQSAGIIFSFAPDMGKAKSAATEMKKLVDRKPEIDTWSKEGEVMSECQGDIEFRDVHFRYPTRPEQPVLRGLDLTVRPGQYVALVGASGCGKSTTIALMERFYDPLVGGVYVDGCDISKLEINNYRRHLALVSQEPTLYQGTIRENILLGADTDPADVPQEAIEQACRDANIYDFILSLPEGFQTVVGSKGSMLSGGQKQRIAIARALLRNPKILLLDEATSALDSESEKVVQAALDKAAKGRTTIAVAHRLSTIQKADMIYVFDQGQIVENGTHAELTAKKGRYFELVNLQSLGKNS